MDTLRSDGELVLRSREEPEAFAELYDRHAEDLLRYFARRTLDPDVAAELTAETFAEAFASRYRYRERGSGAGPPTQRSTGQRMNTFCRWAAASSSSRMVWLGALRTARSNSRMPRMLRR